jgi:hypothetical protein
MIISIVKEGAEEILVKIVIAKYQQLLSIAGWRQYC